MLPRFADIFQQGNRWLNWLEKQPEGSVRPVVIESVTKIMACGTTLMGYTQWCCSSPDCCHTKKVCFRCKSRSCPHCGVKAGAQWIQYLLSLVPDCPWQHIVFTLPCQYWSLIFHNRWLLAEMSRIAAIRRQLVLPTRASYTGRTLQCDIKSRLLLPSLSFSCSFPLSVRTYIRDGSACLPQPPP